MKYYLRTVKSTYQRLLSYVFKVNELQLILLRIFRFDNSEMHSPQVKRDSKG